MNPDSSTFLRDDLGQGTYTLPHFIGLWALDDVKYVKGLEEHIAQSKYCVWAGILIIVTVFYIAYQNEVAESVSVPASMVTEAPLGSENLGKCLDLKN